jgi:hypothetical protein
MYRILKFVASPFKLDSVLPTEGNFLDPCYDLRVASLIITWGHPTGYIYHCQLVLLHGSTGSGVKAYTLVLPPNSTYLVYMALSDCRELSGMPVCMHACMHTHKYLSAITQKNGVEIDINKYFRRLFL